jgi:hypothetical protein
LGLILGEDHDLAELQDLLHKRPDLCPVRGSVLSSEPCPVRDGPSCRSPPRSSVGVYTPKSRRRFNIALASIGIAANSPPTTVSTLWLFPSRNQPSAGEVDLLADS